MSKGTVTGPPSATHGTVKLGINDETDPNFSEVSEGTLLSFGPKYPADPQDVYPKIHDGDYIEFTITSMNGSINPGTCGSLKKIQSRGTVSSTSVAANAQGTLKVTLANPNNCGMVKDDVLTFNNKSGIALRQNDNVEFDNMIKDERTGKITCDVTNKI